MLAASQKWKCKFVFCLEFTATQQWTVMTFHWLHSSPTKPSASGSSSHWTKQEKDRFEEGLVRSSNIYGLYVLCKIQNVSVHSHTIIYAQDFCFSLYYNYNSWRLALVEGGQRLQDWWRVVLFFRSKVTPDSISNIRWELHVCYFCSTATVWILKQHKSQLL